MEGEDDGIVGGEQGVVLSVRQAVGVLGGGLQLHQVHHVDHAGLQLRQLFEQDADGGCLFVLKAY